MSGSPIDRLRILRSSGGFFPLRQKSAIRLAGADRERYLNGQLTIDLSNLPPGIAKSALLLTAKGKICAPLWVWRDNESLVVEVDAELKEDAMARLERYIISDDVALSEVVGQLQVFHVFGSPAAPEGVLRINRLGGAGYDTSTQPTGILQAEAAEVEFLRIERGLPRWGAELDSHTLPQEARLESTSVDFEKGCYVGQEVVSRLKSVGHVNRRLFAFAGTLEPSPEARLFLLLPGATDEPAGVLTSRCHDFELAQTIALGYLNRQFEDADSFLAADAAGNRLGKVEKRPILT